MEPNTTIARTGGVRLPPAMYDRLRKEAYERRISQNVIFTEALTEHFEVLPELRNLVARIYARGASGIPETDWGLIRKMTELLGSGGILPEAASEPVDAFLNDPDSGSERRRVELAAIKLAAIRDYAQRLDAEGDPAGQGMLNILDAEKN